MKVSISARTNKLVKQVVEHLAIECNTNIIVQYTQQQQKRFSENDNTNFKTTIKTTIKTTTIQLLKQQ